MLQVCGQPVGVLDDLVLADTLPEDVPRAPSGRRRADDRLVQRAEKWPAAGQVGVRPAPAGWCSWYVFWQGIREGQVVQNTDWLAANLKQFGCQYVQIDDGWQGVGQGDGVNRDWYVTEKNKFPHGMKWLADYIRAKGLTPGIWLIPFATSDTRLFSAAARVVRAPAGRQQRVRDAQRHDGQDRRRLDRPLRGRSDFAKSPSMVPKPLPYDLR